MSDFPARPARAQVDAFPAFEAWAQSVEDGVTAGDRLAPHGGSIPAGLGWSSDYPLSPSITSNAGPDLPFGSVGVTPEALFSRYSSALTAPATTLYVDRAAATDTGAGDSWATAIQSLTRAVSVAAASPGPVRVNVRGGVYSRTRSLFYTATPIDFDVAFVAVDGRVVTGSFDTFTSSTPDATYPNTYTVSVANVDRVTDTEDVNRWGNANDLMQVSTAAQVNARPGTWALVSGTLYVQRMDGRPITQTNTRVYRDQPQNVYVLGPRRVYFGGDGSGHGFDFEGATNAAVVLLTMPNGTIGEGVAVLADCTARYGGGAISADVNGFGVSGWNGLAAFFRCSADANSSDGFNGHNAQLAPKPFALTVNCSGRDNGRGTKQSCQGLTLHEDQRWIDVAGLYQWNRGGNIRNIGTSRLYALGTKTVDDLGDLRVGGVMPPTGIRLDDQAEGWFERVTVMQPVGQAGWATGSGPARIHRRDCWPTPQPATGPGVIDTY